MKIKNDIIGYPILMFDILVCGLLGATVNGFFGLILFLIIVIPTVFAVDSFFLE